MHFDLESSGEHVLRVNNTSKGVAEICDQIQLVYCQKNMDKKLAFQLRGRLGFADTHLHGRFGALLMKHRLIDHAYGSTTQVSDELFHVLTALLIRTRDSKAKEVKVSPTARKYIIYIAASYESGTGGIGGVSIGSNGSVVSWFSHQLTERICIVHGSGESLGSKELCIPLFSLPGERVCERAYFPDTSDIPTIQLAVVLCDFLSFSLMSTSVIYF